MSLVHCHKVNTFLKTLQQFSSYFFSSEKALYLVLTKKGWEKEIVTIIDYQYPSLGCYSS